MRRRLNDTYTLLEEIGSGGGGVVYKAYHERLKTYVVVKEVRQRVRGQIEDRAEADILKNMKHTCLPRVYDFLEIDGRIYTVIDYVPGQSLDKVLSSRGAIAQEQVLKWAIQLAQTLDYLHTLDPPVIHSDIKPANIMVTPEDNICLIDFNISLALDQSMKDSIGITRGYSPPEQYRSIGRYVELAGSQPAGSLARTIGQGIDTRSDIYSLGATLYHLLTGIRPGYDFSKIVPLEQCGISVGTGLAAIVTKMMDPDPDRRYQSAAELTAALQSAPDLDRKRQRQRISQRVQQILAAVLLILGTGLILAGRVMITEENNENYSGLVYAAEAAIAEGEYETAGALLGEAEEIYPEKLDAKRMEVLLLYAEGDYEGCIEYARELLQDLSDAAEEEDSSVPDEIGYVLGNAYVQLAGASPDEGEAEEYYRKALTEFLSLYDNGYAASQLLENIAVIYEQLDAYDEAEVFLLEMAKNDPDSYVPFKLLAYLEISRQQDQDIGNRDYTAMAVYYVQAFALYDSETGDPDMQILAAFMQEILDGGWLS